MHTNRPLSSAGWGMQMGYLVNKNTKQVQAWKFAMRLVIATGGNHRGFTLIVNYMYYVANTGHIDRIENDDCAIQMLQGKVISRRLVYNELEKPHQIKPYTRLMVDNHNKFIQPGAFGRASVVQHTQYCHAKNLVIQP
jgi:hypothetical protein